MIEIVKTRPDGIVEFTVTGKVTEDDYRDRVIPAIERALAEHDRIRVLAHFETGFEGYSPAAAWADTKLGLSHWRGFERVAAVTDSTLVATGMRLFAPFMPCPVKVFPLGELDDARRWLQESLGTIHIHEGPGNLLRAELIGTLDGDAYDRADAMIDGFVTAHPRIRLIVDLRSFDGWQGLGAVADHLSLVREHRRAPERVAVVGRAGWQKAAERLFGRFIEAESRYFDADEIDAATAWVTEG